MAEKKKAKAKAETKVEETPVEVKAEPKVDEKAFVARKLKAINLLDNAFIAERQAERLRR